MPSIHISNSKRKFLGTPRIEPGAAGREASMLLCAMLNVKIGKWPSNHLTQPNCFQFNGPCDAVIETSELPCPAPEGVWRLLKPGSKLGDAVFVAIPRVSHLVKKRTLFARQKEISKFWSIFVKFTPSKRRISQMLSAEKAWPKYYKKWRSYLSRAGVYSAAVKLSILTYKFLLELSCLRGHGNGATVMIRACYAAGRFIPPNTSFSSG